MTGIVKYKTCPGVTIRMDRVIIEAPVILHQKKIYRDNYFHIG